MPLASIDVWSAAEARRCRILVWDVGCTVEIHVADRRLIAVDCGSVPEAMTYAKMWQPEAGVTHDPKAA
jgi:hypothetical protein